MRWKSFVLAFVFLFFAITAFAQFKASLAGTVQDSKSGVVTGADVTVTNQATGATRR